MAAEPAQPETTLVDIELRDRIAILALNRADKRNAINDDMRADLIQALDWADRSPDVAALVITGRGKGFCAGGDIRALHDSGKEGTPYAVDFYRTEYLLNAFIHHYSKPYVALIDGITMGGGVGVSVHGSQLHSICLQRVSEPLVVRPRASLDQLETRV